ncbi:MAG: hypothetical protein IJF97_09745 [Eggerthellaceae bacterium]|nr:hypothetical protein [Eggerthellaceae bacterium]
MPTSNEKEAAALCMEHLVDHDWHGYTQGWGRWGDGEGTCPVETPIGTCYVEQGDRDCSSAVISSYEAAGIDCGGATYTGNMKSCMLSTGNFRAHRMSDGYNCDDGYIAQRGDCYLNEINHTAMCISAYPDMLAEFSIAENGTIYGNVGDQTGWESSRGVFYGFPWDWCMELIADGSTPAPAPSIDAVRYKVSTDPNGSWWYDEMADWTDTGGSTDDFAGNYGELVRWVAIKDATYRVCSQASGWLPWVSGYNTADLEWGCAGDGSPIVALEVVNMDIKYQVHVYGGEWYAEMQGQVDTGGSSDTYAGDMWNPIDAVAMRRAR